MRKILAIMFLMCTSACTPEEPQSIAQDPKVEQVKRKIEQAQRDANRRKPVLPDNVKIVTIRGYTYYVYNTWSTGDSKSNTLAPTPETLVRCNLEALKKWEETKGERE